jgi:hypothetical protein
MQPKVTPSLGKEKKKGWKFWDEFINVNLKSKDKNKVIWPNISLSHHN